jgi:hypothetical protein
MISSVSLHLLQTMQQLRKLPPLKENWKCPSPFPQLKIHITNQSYLLAAPPKTHRNCPDKRRCPKREENAKRKFHERLLSRTLTPFAFRLARAKGVGSEEVWKVEVEYFSKRYHRKSNHWNTSLEKLSFTERPQRHFDHSLFFECVSLVVAIVLNFAENRLYPIPLTFSAPNHGFPEYLVLSSPQIWPGFQVLVRFSHLNF